MMTTNNATYINLLPQVPRKVMNPASSACHDDP
jgi:hypothetical protein